MLANGLALAGIAVVFTIGFVAHFVSQTNWAWATAAAGATGVGYGALITSVRGPIHLRFAATVAGLTVQQRGQASRRCVAVMCRRIRALLPRPVAWVPWCWLTGVALTRCNGHS